MHEQTLYDILAFTPAVTLVVLQQSMNFFLKKSTNTKTRVYWTDVS